MNRLNKKISDHWTWLSWNLLFPTILLSLIHLFLFPPINGDANHSSVGAMSLTQGLGITIPRVSLNDLSNIVYVPLNQYPPGLSLLMAPLLILTKGNLSQSLFLLNGSMIVLFFLGWFTVIEMLGKAVAPVVKLSVWIIWLFTFNPQSLGSGSDLVAISFFVWVISLSLFCFINNHNSYRYGLAIGLLMSVCIITRYAYWPLSLVFPICWFLCRPKNKVLFKTLVGYLAFIGLTLLILIVWQKGRSGEIIFSAHSLQSNSGQSASSFLSSLSHFFGNLHWSQLLRMYPFPSSSIGLDNLFYRIYFAWINPLPSPFAPVDIISEVQKWLTIPSLLIMAAYLAIVTKAVKSIIKRKPSSKQCHPITFFHLFGLVTFILTLAMLVVLSLTSKGLWTGHAYWSYVENARYYFPCFGFILLGTIQFLWFGIKKS